MKYSRLLLIPILLLIGMTGVYAQSAIYNETTFYDDFNRYAASGLPVGNLWEDVPALGWQSLNANAANCFDDAVDDCVQAAFPSPTSFLTRNISTAGLQKGVLSYMERCDSLAGEYFTVEGQNSTGQFQVLRNITASCTGTKSIQNLTLPANMLDLSSFKARFTCSARGAVRTCTVDNVNVSGERFCDNFFNSTSQTLLPPATYTYNRNANFCSGIYTGLTINTNLTNGIYQCLGRPNACFQETANISTTCGANANPNPSTYVTGGGFPNPTFWYDGDYSTSTILGDGVTPATSRVQYLVPSGVNTSNSRWSIKTSCNGITQPIDQNYQLPKDCFSNVVNITLVKPGFGTPFDYRCTNQSNGADITISNQFIVFCNPNIVFEEAMTWNTSNTQTTFNSSQTNVNKDNATLYNCNFEDSNVLALNSNGNVFLNNNFNLKNRQLTLRNSNFNIIFNNTFTNPTESSIFIGDNVVTTDTSANDFIFNNIFIGSTSGIFSLNLANNNNIFNNKFINLLNPINIQTQGFSNNFFNNTFINTTGSFDIELDGSSPFTFNNLNNISNNNHSKGIRIEGQNNFVSLSLDKFNSTVVDVVTNNTLLILHNNNILSYNRTNIGLNSINNIFLSQNIVALNSSLEPNLNKLARVQLINLTQYNSQPVIVFVDNFTTNATFIQTNGTQCNPPRCQNLVWDNIAKTLTFDVTQWSSYSTVNASAPSNYNVRMLDEDTQALILGNGELVDFIPTSTTFYFTNTGSFGISNLSFEKHRFDVSSTNPDYAQRSYFFTINTSSQNMTVYLLNSTKGQTVKFNVRSSGGTFIENADVIVTKFVGAAYTTVQHENTGIVGFVNTFLNPQTTYRIMISASGYQTRTFDLEPTETEYTIILTQSALVNFNNFLTGITFSTNPSTGPLKGNESQQFLFTTVAPNGTIDYFTIFSNFSGTYYINNLSGSASGGTVNISINTTGKNGQTVQVHYQIKSVGYPDVMDLTKSFLILDQNPSNRSAVAIAEKYKGEFGTTWSSIIAIFVSVIMGITFLQFVGSTGAGFIAIITLIGFALTGWISFSVTLMSIIVVVGTYLMTGGRE